MSVHHRVVPTALPEVEVIRSSSHERRASEISALGLFRGDADLFEPVVLEQSFLDDVRRDGEPHIPRTRCSLL